MIEWSLRAFAACDPVCRVIVAAPPELVEELAGRLGEGVDVLPGGATRAQSVTNALAAVDTELVAIHDAARPFVTAELLKALLARLEAAPEAAAIIAAAPLADTVKRVRAALDVDNKSNAALVVECTEDRSTLWGAQTPQVFRTDALRAALAVPGEVRDAATDESMLVEAAGGRVLLHDAGAANLKVTTRIDLRLAELLLG
jgi:2-C-methyl-D-erythritol 4-phosphate cytidylyltransferase/2-C-methyl-D-erythritol 2,4-cyclodiphosphate synthase